MPSASGEQEEVALSLYEEAEEDLIRLTLQEEDRFVYDETNTGHEDAAESKGPDQEDLDQRYTEKLQEEEGTFALQELGSRGHE